MPLKNKLIELYRPNIENVLTSWAFVPNSLERNRKLNEIIAWIKNFTPPEIEYAIKIMENIQYYDDNRIRSIIEVLSGKIQAIFGDELKDVLFFPLGNSSASSGSMYLYQYRKELRLSEDNFKQDGFEKYLNKNIHIVFFDDIIGSGSQATYFFNKYLKNKTAKCYYFSLLGLQKGISFLKNNTEFEATFVGEILTDEEMAFSENSYVFTEKERNLIKPICEKYGRELFEKHPLGYDDTQALIVFPHNTPNNTLPIIWASDDNEASTGERIWRPLWNRKKVQKKSSKKTKGDNNILNYKAKGIENRQNIVESHSVKETETKAPTVCISYTWDDELHKEWVLNLAKRLRENGIETLLDRYLLRAGSDKNKFMEDMIARSDRALIILTPDYKNKADNRIGGAGYEYSIIISEVYNKQDSTKIIPILRKGNIEEALPRTLESKIAIFMREEDNFEEQLEELCREIHNEPKIKIPKVGSKPKYD